MLTYLQKCGLLNNFSTLTSIISALGTAPIHRLSRTWQQVNGKTKDILEAMRKLMGSTKNFAEYRETLHKANPPCVPFLGVYLTDLTFIEDGIPGLIKKTNLINFAKRAKTAEVIRDIQQYQNVPYPLQPVPELQEYVLGNMKNAGDVHEMYEMSLLVEPKEREDEKIARYAGAPSLPRFDSASSVISSVRSKSLSRFPSVRGRRSSSIVELPSPLSGSESNKMTHDVKSPPTRSSFDSWPDGLPTLDSPIERKSMWTKLREELSEIPLETFVLGTFFPTSYLVAAAHHVCACHAFSPFCTCCLPFFATQCLHHGSHDQFVKVFKHVLTRWRVGS